MIGKKEVPRGTLQGLLHDFEITGEEFLAALK